MNWLTGSLASPEKLEESFRASEVHADDDDEDDDANIMRCEFDRSLFKRWTLFSFFGQLFASSLKPAHKSWPISEKQQHV